MPKFLLLNGSTDRETAGMAASDFVLAITAALNRAHGRYDRAGYEEAQALCHAPNAYVTTVLAPRGGGVRVDAANLEALGIEVVEVEAAADERGGAGYVPAALVRESTIKQNLTKLAADDSTELVRL